jgi:hypothetical protein
MNDHDTRRHEMFLRVREFDTINAPRYAANTFVVDLYNTLNGIIRGLETQIATQTTGFSTTRQTTRSKAAARDELESDLKAISRTARSMVKTNPGVEQKFRFQSRLKDQDLLALARSFATEALPLKAEFVKRGLPADFLDDLADDIEQFEEALTLRMQGTGSHISATAAIDELIERGMEVVSELDPIMRNIFTDDAATLAAWSSASRVERAPRRNRTQSPAPPASPTT